MSTLTRLVVAIATLPALVQTHLQVQSATVDLVHHQADIELFNSGDKTVAAYTLHVQEFDVTGKRVADTITGFDYLYYLENGVKNPSAENNLIRPGATFVYPAPLQVETVKVDASIVSVVNLDCTVEGDAKDAKYVFKGRFDTAAQLRKAALLLGTYPATPEEARTTLTKVRSLPTAVVVGVLHNHFGVPVDDKRPIPTAITSDSEHWKQAVTDLKAQAAFFEAQSHEEAAQ